MSDARQSPRKELIAVRRRVPEGLGVPGAPRGPYLEVREDITEKLEPVSMIVTELLLTFIEWNSIHQFGVSNAPR